MTKIYCKNCGKSLYESKGDDLENRLCRRCECTCIYPKRDCFLAIYFIRDFQDLKRIIPIADEDKLNESRYKKLTQEHWYCTNFLYYFKKLNPKPGEII